MNEAILRGLIFKAQGLKSRIKLSEKWNERKAIVKQNADNCWLYSCLNNLWLNLGYKVSQEEIGLIKNRLTELGVDVNHGNNEMLAGAVICERWNNKNPDRKIAHFSIDFEKDTLLMADLLKNGYSFIYTRSAKDEFQDDIRDNDTINKIHNLRGAWHAVNVMLESKDNAKIVEVWQRGDDHFANYFDYEDVLIFGRNIQSWTIDHAFSFFDYC